MPIISKNVQLICIEFSVLLRPDGLMNIIFNLSPSVNIEVRNASSGDFIEKNHFDI